MTRLIAMRGLPGSGKSSRALQLLDQAPVGTLVRCSRDAYRRMLHGRPRHGDRVCEDQVTLAQHAGIEQLLLAGVDVLVDDTNLSLLNLQALAAIAWRCGAEFVVEDFTHVPLEVCIARDAGRTGDERVGEELIRAMHQRHLRGRRLPLPTPVPNATADLLGVSPVVSAR
jgi:predicted kinase